MSTDVNGGWIINTLEEYIEIERKDYTKKEWLTICRLLGTETESTIIRIKEGSTIENFSDVEETWEVK